MFRGEVHGAVQLWGGAPAWAVALWKGVSVENAGLRWTEKGTMNLKSDGWCFKHSSIYGGQSTLREKGFILSCSRF